MIGDRELTVEDWHRLNRLLATAFELEPHQRSEWLAALPDDVSDLKPLLTDLLATRADSDAPTETLRPVVDLATSALSAMKREQPGDRIGPWRLERLLAEGGMGAVWIAQRADGVMQRTAALKLPRAEWVDHGLTERIARERAILARLQHPNIAVLYDAGLADGGRPYLALEYVDGQPIDAWCRDHDDLRGSVQLMVQVARAVAYAHGQLIIHRDLKPANVLVTADGAPKLLDFGISKLIEGDATATADATALTRLAGRPLTLAYAAPEQILGLPITVTADVHALGVMLFELLTGSRLYRATTLRELEAEILGGDLRRPSDTASAPARARALRGDLDAIVLTALKRDPQARYQSAAALADDLERYLAGKPVRAQPDSAAYRLRKFVARHTLVVAVASAAIIALGTGLGVALWQAREAREQTARATAMTARATAMTARATAMNTFVLSLIQTADPNASPQTRDADLATLTAIEGRIDKEFEGSAGQRLQLRLTLGDAYRNRGEMAAAQRAFQRAVDEAAPHLPADDLLLLTARVRASDTRLVVSTAAAEQLDRAIAVLRRKGDGDAAAAELLIDALLQRHELTHTYGVAAAASDDEHVGILREAEALALRVFGAGSRQHLRVAEPLAQMIALGEGPSAGPTWPLKDGLPAGRQILEQALAHAAERADDAVPSVELIRSRALYALFLCQSRVVTGDWATGNWTAEVFRGVDILRELIQVARNAHGPTSYALESLLDHFAECLATTGDPTGPLLRAEAYDIAAARERPPSNNLLIRAQAAYELALSQRDHAAAEHYYGKVLENVAAISDDALRQRRMNSVQALRVYQLMNIGNAAEAEQVATPLLASFDAEYAKTGRLTRYQRYFYNSLNQVQRQQGRYEDAALTANTLFERCRAMRRLRPHETCDAYALALRAQAELDAGRAADAQATIEERLALSPDPDYGPHFRIAYGRVMIAAGRHAEAIEMLRSQYGWWLAFHPQSPITAEALFWFGKAYLAAGDPRGHWMVAQARRDLAKSPVSIHQRLAAGLTPGS